MSKKQKLDLTDFITSPLRDEETTSIIRDVFNKFLSEERSVRISGQIGKTPTEAVSDIEAPDLDRELNVLVPALYHKTGTEKQLFTFEDMVNRLAALGANTNNLRGMLAEDHFNFVPPIDLDKFINYSNYLWIAEASPKPTLSWNPNLLPEYYVIAKPELTDIYKMPVKLATTRDVKLWGKDRPAETVTVTFSDNQTFTVTGNQGVLRTRTTTTVGTETTTAKTLNGVDAGTVTTVYVLANDASVAAGGYGLNDPATSVRDLLFSFTITAGSAFFSAGDKFEIDITYITGTNEIAFIPTTTSINKGFISNIIADKEYMYIDGVQVVNGDSILVWQQTDPSKNGIYTVRPGQWALRLGNELPQYMPEGSIVHTTDGNTYAGFTFILADAVTNDFAIYSEVSSNPINDWQQNFWVHRNDLFELDSATQAIAVQATRPIIEYSNAIKLNSFVDSSNRPASSGVEYTQRKTRFNQIPQFDLFRCDGTHANKTSGIFFYAEDPDFPIDAGLQRRVKTDVNSDYIFSVGIEDEKKRLLYWKSASSLQTIWASAPPDTSVDLPSILVLAQPQSIVVEGFAASVTVAVPTFTTLVQQYIFNYTSGAPSGTSLMEPPAAVLTWTDVKAYLTYAYWDDSGSVVGNVATVTPTYVPGFITYYNQAGNPAVRTYVHSGATAITVNTVNNAGGAIGVGVYITWEGMAPAV